MARAIKVIGRLITFCGVLGFFLFAFAGAGAMGSMWAGDFINEFPLILAKIALYMGTPFFLIVAVAAMAGGLTSLVRWIFQLEGNQLHFGKTWKGLITFLGLPAVMFDDLF